MAMTMDEYLLDSDEAITKFKEKQAADKERADIEYEKELASQSAREEREAQKRADEEYERQLAEQSAREEREAGRIVTRKKGRYDAPEREAPVSSISGEGRVTMRRDVPEEVKETPYRTTLSYIAPKKEPTRAEKLKSYLGKLKEKTRGIGGKAAESYQAIGKYIPKPIEEAGKTPRTLTTGVTTPTRKLTKAQRRLQRAGISREPRDITRKMVTAVGGERNPFAGVFGSAPQMGGIEMRSPMAGIAPIGAAPQGHPFGSMVVMQNPMGGQMPARKGIGKVKPIKKGHPFGDLIKI